jgi:hypothetical protein
MCAAAFYGTTWLSCLDSEDGQFLMAASAHPNYVDNRGYDYPLLKPNTYLLNRPLILHRSFRHHFLRLHPIIITLLQFFSIGEGERCQKWSRFPRPMKITFFYDDIDGCLCIYFILRTKAPFIFNFPGSHYRLSCIDHLVHLRLFLRITYPPLSILHFVKEYGYIGYVLYVTLLGSDIRMG